MVGRIIDVPQIAKKGHRRICWNKRDRFAGLVKTFTSQLFLHSARRAITTAFSSCQLVYLGLFPCTLACLHRAYSQLNRTERGSAISPSNCGCTIVSWYQSAWPLYANSPSIRQLTQIVDHGLELGWSKLLRPCRVFKEKARCSSKALLCHIR
jgi:hypothetical protein